MGDETQDSGRRDEPPMHPLAPDFGGAEGAEGTAFETIVGFLGSSPRSTHLRVYADLSFRSYCEVDRSDVRQMKLVDPDDHEGPVVVTVRAEADVEYVQVSRLNGKASYVAGAIRTLHYDTRVAATDWFGEYAAREYFGHPPFPITPQIACASRVFPSCPPGPPPVSPVLFCPLPPIPLSRAFPPC